jgi:hypothetical protein
LKLTVRLQNQRFVRGINNFIRVFTTNTVQHEKGDIATDCHSILAGWRNHSSQLLNVHGVNEVSRNKNVFAEPLGLEPSFCEFEMAIEKLKRPKSPFFIKSQLN